jgi:hypothetical protein
MDMENISSNNNFIPFDKKVTANRVVTFFLLYSY